MVVVGVFGVVGKERNRVMCNRGYSGFRGGEC